MSSELGHETSEDLKEALWQIYYKYKAALVITNEKWIDHTVYVPQTPPATEGTWITWHTWKGDISDPPPPPSKTLKFKDLLDELNVLEEAVNTKLVWKQQHKKADEPVCEKRAKLHFKLRHNGQDHMDSDTARRGGVLPWT